MLKLKNHDQIARIHESCRLLARMFQEIAPLVQPGITTLELDKWAYDFVVRHKGKPAFKGYMGFPATLCISINQEVIHGIPKDRKILEGDLVSIDSGIDLGGYFSDMAKTYAVGKILPQEQTLLDVTQESLSRAVGSIAAGGRIRNIATAVTDTVKPYHFGIVHQYCGHGVGFSQHEDPQVPNALGGGPNPRIVPGMVLAVEPMINLGKAEVRVLSDQWTVVTVDGKKSAHFEHTVAVWEDRVEVLTLPE